MAPIAQIAAVQKARILAEALPFIRAFHASTLIIRFGTLWYGVLVGLVALGLVSRVLARKRRMSVEASDDLPIDLPTEPAST